jgi:transcriptional regulator with XRE-family HTH domain
MDMLLAQQIRGARAMLGLTQAELAREAGIPAATLDAIERGEPDPKPATLRALKVALERAGVAFIEQNGGGPGVRLTQRSGGQAALRPDELNASNDE